MSGCTGSDMFCFGMMNCSAGLYLWGLLWMIGLKLIIPLTLVLGLLTCQHFLWIQDTHSYTGEWPFRLLKFQSLLLRFQTFQILFIQQFGNCRLIENSVNVALICRCTNRENVFSNQNLSHGCCAVWQLTLKYWMSALCSTEADYRK